MSQAVLGLGAWLDPPGPAGSRPGMTVSGGCLPNDPPRPAGTLLLHLSSYVRMSDSVQCRESTCYLNMSKRRVFFSRGLSYCSLSRLFSFL